MAKTTLRAYNRDIETILDRGQLDEAVAHCHHILQTYPKNLSTYRLLGKAYLEMKRYGDATDIFTRVLDCVPNDFVANVGMSLIRDEENKLDDAVMHMERAFETQPSNAAVQSELQRLYGRRDGVQPPRIRMTRGALAHMYVKGELYPQAISEIKSVIKEDPGRADMEALLSRAYFRSGQKNDAMEVASSLLRRYPYCYDANAILVDIHGADKSDSVQTNRQRVIELDPYAAHVSGSVLDTSDAPDSAISIERLDWNGQSVSMPADWRETRGISSRAASHEEPDWLKQNLAQTETTLPPAGETAFRMDASAQPAEEIPDFLRDAGWGASTGAFDESKSSMMDAEETLPPTSAAPIAAGDMPDWIKAMAPTENEKSSADEPMPDWMNRIDPSILPSAPESTGASDQPDWLKDLGGAPQESSQPAAGFSDQPDWLKDLGGSTDSSSQPQTSSADQPDWMKDLGGPTEGSTQPVAAINDQPDWLNDLGGSSATPSQSATDETPDWMKEMSAAAEMPTLAPASGSSDFLNQITGQPQESKAAETPSAPQQAASTPSAQSEDDAFAWLESLAVKQGSTEGLLLKEEDRPQEEPDWVKQAKSLSAEVEIPTAPPLAPEPAEEISAAPIGTVEELGKSDKDQDDSFAWLESLAVKQGSTEGLLIKPEDRTESEPDWVKQAKEIGEPLTPPAPEETRQPERSMDTALWLKSLEAEVPAAEPVKESSADETAAWLKNLGAEDSSAEPVKESPADETAMWLKSLDEAEKPVETASAPREDLPDWMQNIEAEEKASADEAAVPAKETESSSVDWASETTPEVPERIDTGSLPSWLQDVDADVPVSSSREAFPAWLRDETGEAVAEPTRIEPTRAEEWKPAETQEPVFEAPVEQPKPEPKPKKAVPPAKKPEPRAETPVAKYQEPVTRKGTGMLTQTVDMVLGQARNELNRSNIPGALETYSKLIKKGRHLEEIIFDLREASYRYPVEVSIWQTLGDAYMRGNRLQDALDSYTKAEELLR